ncbi:MAG: FAD-dependent oxidoreductase, partial [Planctomycetes bacterium]|nr:FAD-dependent oxidoreductase [Planctomycetota bacterium]
MTGQSQRVIVIGGGVVGTSCAYYLAREGFQVTIIDRGSFGGGCSQGNCGLICPSHVLPLAEPGAVRSALRLVLKRNSPLAIRPRWDPPLWGWLVRFARRCNHRDMMEAAAAIRALMQSSAALYRELMAVERLDCQWQERGLLLVFRSPAEMEKYAETDRLLRTDFGTPATRYDGQAVVELEPALKEGLAGGWHYETDAHLRPDRLMSAWRGVLETLGVTIREGCELIGLESSGGKAVAIHTSLGRLVADHYVVATGATAPFLKRQLGCHIPIQPGKGYCLTTPRPTPCPQIPLIFPEHKVAVTPFADGYRLGSTMEFAGYDSSLRPARLQLLRDGAEPYLRQPHCEPVLETWFGWRPMTYD